jgi:RNA polymerase-binding protein DksA
MAPAKKTSGRKKTPARPSSSTKTSGSASAKRKTTAVKKTTKKPTKRTTKKTSTKKTARKSTRRTAKKTAAKKTPKKTARKSTSKKAAAKRTSKKTTPKTAARKTGKKPTRKAATAPAARPGRGPDSARRAAGPETVKPRARAVKFDKKQLEQVRRQLESERGNLLAQLEELTTDSFDGTQSEMTGEVGLDDDFADAGSATFERERDLSIQNNVRDLIAQMNRAIQRIEDGNYGTCERCGNPIEAARLKALPHALLCMDCKRREERAR